MAAQNKVRVAVNGYGVIGKRVAHAITLQDDMTLTLAHRSHPHGTACLR